MTEKMYKLIEKEVKKDVEKVEDEYKYAFISLAKRANKYLTNYQKEDLLQDVEEAVRQAINKAHGRDKRSQPAAAPLPPPVAISVKIDTFSRIELFPSNVLSSEKTNCKNDIQ